jgi:hypothetical protein
MKQRREDVVMVACPINGRNSVCVPVTVARGSDASTHLLCHMFAHPTAAAAAALGSPQSVSPVARQDCVWSPRVLPLLCGSATGLAAVCPCQLCCECEICD